MHCAVDRALFGGGAQYFHGILAFNTYTHGLGMTAAIFKICFFIFICLMILEYWVYRRMGRHRNIYIIAIVVFTVVDFVIMFFLLDDAEMIPKEDKLGIPYNYIA